MVIHHEQQQKKALPLSNKSHSSCRKGIAFHYQRASSGWGGGAVPAFRGEKPGGTLKPLLLGLRSAIVHRKDSTVTVIKGCGFQDLLPLSSYQ